MARGKDPGDGTVTRVAVIPDADIGPEVVRSGIAVMRAAASGDSSPELEFGEFPWGSGYYLERGVMMPEDALETLHVFDEIYPGALGWPAPSRTASLCGACCSRSGALWTST